MRRASPLLLLVVGVFSAASAGPQGYLPSPREARQPAPAGPRRPATHQLQPAAAGDGQPPQPPVAGQLQPAPLEPPPVVRRRLVRVSRRRGGRRPGGGSPHPLQQRRPDPQPLDARLLEQLQQLQQYPQLAAGVTERLSQLEQGREARSPQFAPRANRAFSLGGANQLAARPGPGGGFPVRHQPQLQYIGAPDARDAAEQYSSTPDPRDVSAQYGGESLQPEPPQQQQQQPGSGRGGSRFKFEPIPYDESDSGEQLGDGLGEVEEEPDPLSELLTKSSFKCEASANGYFADDSVDCKVFHYCAGGVKHSWTCPEGMLFHQINLICMPMSSDNICKRSSDFHFVNDYLYKELNETVGGKPLYAQRYSPDSFDTLGLYSDPTPHGAVPYSNELSTGGLTPTSEPYDGFSTELPSGDISGAAGVDRNRLRPLGRPDIHAGAAPNRLDLGHAGAKPPPAADRLPGGRGGVRRLQRPIPSRDFADETTTPAGLQDTRTGGVLGRPQTGFRPLNVPGRAVTDKSSQGGGFGALDSVDPAIAHINALTTDFGDSQPSFSASPAQPAFGGSHKLPGSRFSNAGFPASSQDDFSSLDPSGLGHGLFQQGSPGLGFSSQTPSLDAGIFTQHGPSPSGSQAAGGGFSRGASRFSPQGLSSLGEHGSAAAPSHQTAPVAADGRPSLLALGADGIRLSGAPSAGRGPAPGGGHSSLGAGGGGGGDPRLGHAAASVGAGGRRPGLGQLAAAGPLHQAQLGAGGAASFGGRGGFSRRGAGFSGDFSQAGQGSFTESGLQPSQFAFVPQHF